MIIIGYQGIGKSSISKPENRCIDLESSNFFVDGKRDEFWYIIYCNIAEHLSQQGYTVFTSSHQVVRDCLRKSDKRKVIAYPSLGLKDEWIERLQDRYNREPSDKNYKALMNAKDRYLENIQELIDEPGFEKLEITTTDYDLKDLIADTYRT